MEGARIQIEYFLIKANVQKTNAMYDRSRHVPKTQVNTK